MMRLVGVDGPTVCGWSGGPSSRRMPSTASQPFRLEWSGSQESRFAYLGGRKARLTLASGMRARVGVVSDPPVEKLSNHDFLPVVNHDISVNRLTDAADSHQTPALHADDAETRSDVGEVASTSKEAHSRPGLNVNRRAMLGLSTLLVGAAAADRCGATKSLATVLNPEPVSLTLDAAKKPGSWLIGSGEGVSELPFGMEKPKESRVYDATVLGEPLALSNKSRAWQRMLSARVVYLGEAEGVHDPTDKALELEIVRQLRDECFAQQRPITVAFSAFPRPLQPALDLFFSNRIPATELRAMVPHWPPGRWEETLPLLNYCRENGVRLYAAGVPPEVLRTVQSQGIRALPPGDRKKYAPALRSPIRGAAVAAAAAASNSNSNSNSNSIPGVADTGPVGALQSVGNALLGMLPGLDIPAVAEGVLPRASLAQGPGPYLFAQARVVEDHTMAQAVSQAMAEGSALGLVVAITGASHVRHGARGSGVPARMDTKLKKTKQVVVLLNPERQVSRGEGTVPEADLLWYSGSRACRRNCFDRAEVARVMGAAGRTRDALPQDLQLGIERGLIAPETLQSFFELESQPWIAEATERFQGLRERFYADPRFLHRLLIEESISITTTLMAQYQKRGPRFWRELEYVITDTVRGAVVDFFTVWLPAPTLSFDSRAMDDPRFAAGGALPGGGVGGGSFLEGLSAWVARLPDNAFQRAGVGEEWSLADRLGAVLMGGLKLFSVGFVSSVGTVGFTNGLLGLRKALSTGAGAEEVVGGGAQGVKRSPVLKTALVYGTFLGTSANLRYQVIAGAVEHWVADYFLASQPLLGGVLSFVARTGNSYFGTGQWVDLARFFGLQAHADEAEPQQQRQNTPQLPPPQPPLALPHPTASDDTSPSSTNGSSTSIPSLDSPLAIAGESTSEDSMEKGLQLVPVAVTSASAFPSDVERPVVPEQGGGSTAAPRAIAAPMPLPEPNEHEKFLANLLRIVDVPPGGDNHAAVSPRDQGKPADVWPAEDAVATAETSGQHRGGAVLLEASPAGIDQGQSSSESLVAEMKATSTGVGGADDGFLSPADDVGSIPPPEPEVSEHQKVLQKLLRAAAAEEEPSRGEASGGGSNSSQALVATGELECNGTDEKRPHAIRLADSPLSEAAQLASGPGLGFQPSGLADVAGSISGAERCEAAKGQQPGLEEAAATCLDALSVDHLLWGEAAAAQLRTGPQLTVRVRAETGSLSPPEEGGVDDLSAGHVFVQEVGLRVAAGCCGASSLEGGGDVDGAVERPAEEKPLVVVFGESVLEVGPGSGKGPTGLVQGELHSASSSGEGPGRHCG